MTLTMKIDDDDDIHVVKGTSLESELLSSVDAEAAAAGRAVVAIGRVILAHIWIVETVNRSMGVLVVGGRNPV